MLQVAAGLAVYEGVGTCIVGYLQVVEIYVAAVAVTPGSDGKLSGVGGWQCDVVTFHQRAVLQRRQRREDAGIADRAKLYDAVAYIRRAAEFDLQPHVKPAEGATSYKLRKFHYAAVADSG